jgi:hypothetical protein
MPKGGGPGSERLNPVRVATCRGTLEIPRDSRDALLNRIGDLESGKNVRAAFESVGASRPVELSRGDAMLLVRAIDDWARLTGALRLPAGLMGLRNELFADLRDE